MALGMMRLRAASCAIAVAMALTAQAWAASGPQTLRLLAWADFIAPGVISQFERESGTQVVYDAFDSYNQAQTRLRASPAAYDVAMASPAMVAAGVADHSLALLDRSALSQWGGLDPFIQSRLALFDPGNRHAVDYAWFTTGLAWNIKQAQARLGGRPIDSWDVLFRPDEARRFSDCGLALEDDPDDVLSAVLRWQGQDPNSKNSSDLRRAADAVFRIKSFVRKFDSLGWADGLTDGDLCLAFGRSGEGRQARARAKQGASDIDLAFVAPREGARLVMDALVVPAASPQIKLATSFIDFLMRPDIAAKNANATGYASGVAAARPLMDSALAADPIVYPDESAMRRLYVVTPDPAADKIVAREWSRAKSGK